MSGRCIFCQINKNYSKCVYWLNGGTQAKPNLTDWRILKKIKKTPLKLIFINLIKCTDFFNSFLILQPIPLMKYLLHAVSASTPCILALIPLRKLRKSHICKKKKILQNFVLSMHFYYFKQYYFSSSTSFVGQTWITKA